MSGREWCTLDEWLQCHRPLCPLVVRHDGRVEQPTGAAEQGALNGKPGQTNGAHQKGVRVCFASRRLGATFLEDGTCQVSPSPILRFSVHSPKNPKTLLKREIKTSGRFKRAGIP